MYREIGIIVVILAIVSIILLAFAFHIARGKFKERNSIAAGIASSVFDFFYKPLMGTCQIIGKSPEHLHEIMVSTKNAAAKNRFRLTKKRIIIAPHCMRHRDCPAHVTRTGIQCRSCGKCVYAQIMKIAKREKYDVYIITGSSSVKHVLKSEDARRTDGILAIGCYYELNKGMRDVSKYKQLTTCGYPLLNTGCYNTTIDLIGFEEFVKSLRHPDFKETEEQDAEMQDAEKQNAKETAE